MKNVKELYKNYCETNNIKFHIVDDVKPYDETTLFSIAGMQQYKKLFVDENYMDTICNIQPCLRLNDLDEIGDGSHFLYFNMLGFFSCREKTISEVIDFWFVFITEVLKIPIDYITIHPDKKDWCDYYTKYNVEIRYDNECTWSDNNIGGYCTEFYSNGIEIGNIVNPLDTCIDCGFGLERLEMLVNKSEPSTEIDILKSTIDIIIKSGYIPSNTKQGYILRKLLRKLYVLGGVYEHVFFTDEKIRQEKVHSRYLKLRDKHIDKPKEWWFDTHGIDIDLYI